MAISTEWFAWYPAARQEGATVRILRSLAILDAFYVSMTSLWGGAVLIAEAHGNPWRMMPLSLLVHSPFHSWLIPGIILFCANGLLAAWPLWLALRQKQNYGRWLSFQGAVLLVWLSAECLLLRTVIWPHYFYGALGLFLVLSGFALQRASTAYDLSF